MDRADVATWDRLAPRYGRQERFELRAIDTMLRLAAPGPDERLLDVATGTGLVLRRLAARPARPREAIGVDRSPGMLARAGDLPPGCSTLLADARRIPLPDGWADVVTCAYALHLLDRPQRAAMLAEVRRLLRGDTAGRLVVATVWVDERRAGGRVAATALRLAARIRPRVLGGLRPLDPSADLRAAGFAVTRRVVLPRGGFPSLVLFAAVPSGRRDAPGTC